MGIMTAAMQPSRVPAHCMPRFENIWRVNKGKPAAITDRSMMLAATAEAALESEMLACVALYERHGKS